MVNKILCSVTFFFEAESMELRLPRTHNIAKDDLELLNPSLHFPYAGIIEVHLI